MAGDWIGRATRGANGSGQNPPKAEGFTLADLAKHKTKTVDQLLSESVRQYLESSLLALQRNWLRRLRVLGLSPRNAATFPGVDEAAAPYRPLSRQEPEIWKRQSQIQSISVKNVTEWAANRRR